jgi:hypothetical protein
MSGVMYARGTVFASFGCTPLELSGVFGKIVFFQRNACRRSSWVDHSVRAGGASA